MNQKYDRAVKRRNAEIKDLNKEVKSLQNKVDKLCDRRDYLEECICTRKKKINELFGIIRKHKSSLHTIRQEHKLLRKTHEALQEEYQKTRLGMEVSVDEVNDCISIIGDISHRNAQLKGKLDHMKRAHAGERDKLLGSLVDLRGILLRRNYGGG